jgi:fluoroacetyl-CoA thioesterase
MDIENLIKPGLWIEESFRVEEKHLAVHTGGASFQALATSSMIMWTENICHRLLEKKLPAGISCVTVLVKMQHLSPTPAGAKLRIHCEVLDSSSKEITLRVKIWDEHELVGEGRHTMVVVDKERFTRRIEAKLAYSDQ